MNIRSAMLGVIVTGMLSVSPAQAQKRMMFISVEELSQDCRNEGEICLGFIIGVADALEATAWPAKRSCRGKEVQLQEVLDLASGLLVEPPANKAEGPAFDYLADAVVEKWPC
ncbi:Rap1a/Tai family immunity protein [Devosia sp. 2618]|uniref:Rap1a/Tai family immunity protein n=1 Tax=Devosia sp. 2618 TaxID=3156454 RepID=UPI003399E9A9